VLDAQGQLVGPGFVDAHTHLVFAGERSAEFDLRCQGATYLQIAQAGGGIASTVRATRAASEEELVQLALPRLQRLLEHGITTAEVKSGYGLDVENELKMLRVVRRLSALQPVELVPTLLCAHAVPEEYRGRSEAYLELCQKEILPAVAQEGLARFCDVFVEEGAFTPEQARRLLGAARDLGLRPRLHVDQLTAKGGAELAAELGAATADHLEQVSEAGIHALAGAEVTAVLVPTSTLFLRVRPYAPGRRLREAGVNVALGTNLNPGSAMSENLPLALGLACLENGLTAAEAFWAATRGAALALGLNTYGRLAVGDPANLVIFSCSNYRHLPYHLGINHARIVIQGGHVVRDASAGMSLCP
jgi:imidazolonepropionase